MIPDDKITEVLQVAKISDFVAPHVDIKRRGHSMTGLCPFHAEKTPSFSINDDKGFFHCFGCGEGGNTFKFLMKIESLTFPEAVRKVAARYGIEIEDRYAPARSARDKLFEINASAAHYFRRCLLETAPGERFRDYLVKRGVSEKASEQFGLGVAPPSGDGLSRWFERERLDVGAGIKLGLLVRREGRVFDRFRARLMFPIRDTQGRVSGFGGRSISDSDGPKYLNSPESEVYKKSRALYGLFEAREALRKSDSCFLVEGYLDVIALHDAGIGNSVATCGTALTVEQARLLKRFAGEVVTLFDGDRAGMDAAARSFPIFIGVGIWPKGVFLPEGEDPDSYVRKLGADKFREAVRQAVPLVDAYTRRVVEGSPAGAGGAAKAGAELAAVLARIGDPFEYDLLVRKASLWTGLSEEMLRAQGRKAGPSRTEPSPTRSIPRGGAPGSEELLVSVLLSEPTTAARVVDSGVLESMESPAWKALADSIVERAGSNRSVDIGELLESLNDSDRARVVARLNDGTLDDPDTREKILSDCIKGIERTARRRHNLEIVTDMRQKEELGQDVASEKSLRRWKPSGASDA